MRLLDVSVVVPDALAMAPLSRMDPTELMVTLLLLPPMKLIRKSRSALMEKV